MSADAPPRVEILFYEALELPSDAREAFLNDACDADVNLRAEMDELLLAHDGAEGFLQVDAPASPKLVGDQSFHNH